MIMTETNNIPYEKFFQQLWDLAKSLLQVIGKVWNWLTTPLKIDIPLLSNIPIIGNWFNISLNYTPLQLLGAGLLMLVGLWVVKKLIPLG